MKFPIIVLVSIFLFVALVQADSYEVLVVGIAEEGDSSKIEEFEIDAIQFNGLHLMGYRAAKPYFNLLRMINGQVYFVFGFRGAIQGIHRRDYPGTLPNLQRLNKNGAPKYPGMHWLPVEEIRRLLAMQPSIGLPGLDTEQDVD